MTANQYEDYLYFMMKTKDISDQWKERKLNEKMMLPVKNYVYDHYPYLPLYTHTPIDWSCPTTPKEPTMTTETKTIYKSDAGYYDSKMQMHKIEVEKEPNGGVTIRLGADQIRLPNTTGLKDLHSLLQYVLLLGVK